MNEISFQGEQSTYNTFHEQKTSKIFQEQKSACNKFQETNQFHEEKNQCTSFTKKNQYATVASQHSFRSELVRARGCYFVSSIFVNYFVLLFQ